ncbi:hypothetical protein PYW07_007036 [Mythimna separata]|uniref:Ricin B lectin domain-containing protein n=1 Tax=Mythimna separata TaxID=271217 RepID=A0AAD8E141_MYTSE|nr:hypothetical protein PYW07_007036 [Mythimna separata]
MKFLVVLAALVAICASSAIPLIPGDNSHYVEGESRYVWMPDGEGVPQLVDLEEPVDEALLNSRNGANNQYWLYSRQNPTNPQVIVNGNANSIWNSNYRANPNLVLPIVMKFLVVLAALVALCASSAIPLIPGDNSHYVEGESRYIWMPDGDGVPHLVDLQEPVDEAVLNSRNGANNQYWLFTRQNPTSAQIIVNETVSTVSALAPAGLSKGYNDHD